MSPESLEERISQLESDLARLKQQVKANRVELGANSRGTLVFVAGLFVMLALGSRYSDGQYSYQVELEHLSTLIGLPAVASVIAALIPASRR